MKRNQIEDGGIGCPVIRRVGDLLKVSEFSEPHFMSDLPRFGVVIVVFLFRLVFGELLERPKGEGRVNHHILQRDNQTVPAENRHKPGHTRSG